MKKITAQTLLQTYLHLMCIITLTAGLFSGAYLIQTGLSYITPLHFSYTLYRTNTENEIEEFGLEECYEESEVIEIGNNTYCWDESTRQEGLINSATIFISMSILFTIHSIGIKNIKENKITPIIEKTYTFVSLMIYSIVGVIIIPTSIYLVLNYFIFGIDEGSTGSAPAYALGLLVLSLPLWYIFFKRTNKLKD